VLAVLINVTDGRTGMTKVIGPVSDYANGLKRKFLARRRSTAYKLQRTPKIFGEIIFVY
jgi:hypothetical protein